MNKIEQNNLVTQQQIKILAILVLHSFLSSFFRNWAEPSQVFSIAPNEPLTDNSTYERNYNASYLVINNTSVRRDGNIVQYLPPNVIVFEMRAVAEF